MRSVKLAKTNTWNVAALAVLILALTLSTGATIPQTDRSSSPTTRPSTSGNSVTETRPSAQPPNNDPGAPAQGQGSNEEQAKRINYMSSQGFRDSWKAFWGGHIDAFFKALARFAKDTILPIVSNALVPVTPALLGFLWRGNRFKGFAIGSAATFCLSGLAIHYSWPISVLEPKIGPVADNLIGTAGILMVTYASRRLLHNLSTLSRKTDIS